MWINSRIYGCIDYRLVLMLHYTLSCLFSNRFRKTTTVLTGGLLKRRILLTCSLGFFPPIKRFGFTFPGCRRFHKFIAFIKRLEYALKMHMKKGGTLFSLPAHTPLPYAKAARSQGTRLKEHYPYSVLLLLSPTE